MNRFPASERALWSVLIALLVVNIPAFVCMGLDPDALQWDLCTRTVLEGRILYRDCGENNLPGMLAPLAVIHSLFGWRSEVLRVADLLIVLVIAWQLTNRLPSGATRCQRLGLAVALLVFYLSTSEWCHCQRDIWMMVPALAALSLRVRQAARLLEPGASARTILGAAFVEGLLWAAAFWVKPHVAVPALACWMLSARLAAGRLPLLLDGAAVLAGGVVAGAAGVVWLVVSGAWPSFVELVIVWNREYVAHDMTEGEYGLCLAGLLYRLFPWIVVHFVAVPVALGGILRRRAAPETLLGGFYLGWLLQSVLLQHLFDYVHVPPIFLGITVVAAWYAGHPEWRRVVLACLLMAVLLRFPSLCLGRLTAWGDCVRDGSTPALRDRLAWLRKGNWSDLARVEDFLRDREVRDGELSIWNVFPLSLYDDLGVRPATRFTVIENYLRMLPRRRAVLYGELGASRQRFMVCDIEAIAMEKLRAGLGEGAVPGAPPPAAWAERVVFRSGRYIVLRLSGPETPAWAEAVLHDD